MPSSAPWRTTVLNALLLRLPSLPVVAYRLTRLARLVRGVATTALQDALSQTMERTTDPLVRFLFHRPMSSCLRLTAPYWRLRGWASEPEEYRTEAAWEAQATGDDPAGSEWPSAGRALAEALHDLLADTRCPNRACNRPLWHADSWCRCWEPEGRPAPARLDDPVF
jgi:hypothetical protein